MWSVTIEVPCREKIVIKERRRHVCLVLPVAKKATAKADAKGAGD